MNADKTEVIWLGKMKNSSIRFAPHLKIIWNPKQFKILGIWFGHDFKECTERNYRDKLAEVKYLFKCWIKRSITPVGRVAVLKSLILSKIVHLWILLPHPPDHYMSELQNLCFNFVWNGKNDKINRKCSIKPVKKGGLNIPNVKKYAIALKLSWIKKLKQTQHKWKDLCLAMFPSLKQIEYYGSSYFLQKANHNQFWKDVFSAYHDFCQHVNPTKSEDLLAEPVFYNINLKVGGKIISNYNLMKNGVRIISDFLTDRGDFYGILEFNDKYVVRVDFLTYANITASIKDYLKKERTVIENNYYNPYPLALKTIYKVEKGSKEYYELLTDNEQKPNCCQKWEEKLNILPNWRTIFLKVHKINDANLKWLQLRIIHRILGTNIVLKHMNVVTDVLCNFCRNDRDSVQHIFWQCDTVKTFWNDVERSINKNCNHASNFKFTQSLVLFGVDKLIKTDKVLDYIILIAKKFVYSCRYNKILPIYQNFMTNLKHRYKIEEHNAKLSISTQAFKGDWIPYQNLINT